MKEVRSIEERVDVFRSIVVALKDLDPQIQARMLEAVRVFLQLPRIASEG